MPVTTSTVTLDFFLHCGLIHSERLDIQGTWHSGDALDFTSRTNRQCLGHPCKTATTAACSAQPPLPHLLLPTNLAIGDALSMAASCMTCHLYTRAHIVHAVHVEEVGRAWQQTLAFVGRSIFQCGFRSVQAVAARASVVACFVERVASSQFSIGIVTQKAANTAEGAAALRDVIGWVDACRLPVDGLSYFAELPMCKPQRATSLRLWVEQATRQVSVGQVVPPIHVSVRHVLMPSFPTVAAVGSGPTLAPHQTAFSCVRLFLTRPVEGSMGGITLLPMMSHLGQKGGDGPLKPEQHNPSVQSFHPANSRSSSPPSHTVVTVAANGETVTRETFVFDNVVVGASGETLIGVECRVHDAYRPFVPPMLQFVPPFLVLGQ